MCTGEVFRFTESAKAFSNFHVPSESYVEWRCGALVTDNLNKGMAKIMTYDEGKLQWIWVMGDDHSYPAEVLMNLLERELDVVVPLCLNRIPPLDPFITVWDGDKKARGKHITELPTDQPLYKLAENETCGDAGLLIRRHVMNKLKFPYYDHSRTGSLGADDQWFIKDIQDAGFDVYIDLENVLGHLTPLNIIPIKTDKGWVVRLATGYKLLVDIEPHYRKVSGG